MGIHFRFSFIALLILVALVGCSGGDSPTPDGARGQGAKPNIVRLEPGAEAASKIQEALILAKPGDVIELAEGKYEFTSTLSLDGVENVTLRGEGMEKTILSFAKLGAGTGGEGVLIKAPGAVIEDLAIEDVPSDGLKIITSKGGVIARRVRVEWTGGPSVENGGYGIYPVMSKRILVEDCVVRGASDAGIYVGQSTDVVVRRNRVEGNVAGIEIENCLRSDVYDNDATGNTGGILVFSLPGLVLKGGAICRVFDNRIVENNHENFAEEGNIVGLVPPGTGMMIMAYDQVEVFGNTFTNNQTVNMALVSYEITEYPWTDMYYNPFVRSVSIHDNKFEGGGDKPAGRFGTALGIVVGGKFPDIAYDGVFDAEASDGPADNPAFISISENGDADFANLDLANFEPLKFRFPKVSRDAAPYAKPLDPLPAVTWEGLE